MKTEISASITATLSSECSRRERIGHNNSLVRAAICLLDEITLQSIIQQRHYCQQNNTSKLKPQKDFQRKPTIYMI